MRASIRRSQRLRPARASASSASISTASRRSTICSAMPPATARCRPFAARIGALLDERQMMARLGGDEFAILLPDITGPRRPAGLPNPFWKHFATRAMRRKSRSPPASALRSAPTMRWIVRRCSTMPTWRSIAPSRKAATPIASSRRRWAPRFATAACSNTICGLRCRAANCGSPISRSSTSSTAMSWASRRWCAGRTRPAAKSRRASSSRLPKRSARSCRSASGY